MVQAIFQSGMTVNKQAQEGRRVLIHNYGVMSVARIEDPAARVLASAACYRSDFPVFVRERLLMQWADLWSPDPDAEGTIHVAGVTALQSTR